MHQSAASNLLRHPWSVACGCLAVVYVTSGCASSDSPNNPVLASGGTFGSGGASPSSSGGNSQTVTGGAAPTQSGGAAQGTVGGAVATGGAATSQTGGVSSVPNGGATVSNGGTVASTGGAASDGSGGTAVSGGAAGAAGAADPCAPKSCTSTADCIATQAKSELITDFSNNASDFRSAAVEWWKELFGGTYVYPALDACKATQPSNPLTQTFTDGSWHIAGTVGNYSGFGLWLAPCMADFSAYKGISFTISGNAGATGAVMMSVATAATSKPDSGTCSPNTATCVETTASPCTAASKSIPVTAVPTTVTVLWSDLTGGSPEASPGASAITSIAWGFDWLWSNTAANNYAVDLVIDDLKLVP